MICACAQSSGDGLRAVLRFINLILSGTLPRASFLLSSVLVALQKVTDGVPDGGVRPIAIGEAWYRLAMLCALSVKKQGVSTQHLVVSGRLLTWW